MPRRAPILALLLALLLPLTASAEVPLIEAATAGDGETVQRLLAQGADLEAKDKEEGKTALMWAAKKGHAAIVETLLAKGAAVDARDNAEQTAVMSAAGYGHLAIVETLLAAGADVNAKNFHGWTALMRAASEGHSAIMRTLLAKGANVSAQSTFGWTALIRAAIQGHTNIVQALLEKGADLEAKDNEEGKTALMWAAGNGHTAIVQLLGRAGAKDPRGLVEAAKAGDAETVNRLLAQGADVNARDKSGATALVWAALSGHTAIVRLLLDKGADVNAKGPGGTTALMEAAAQGYTAIVRALLAKGADIDATNEMGKTALDYAMGYPTGQNRPLVVELIKRAALGPPVAESGEAERARAETEKIKAETEKVKAETEKARAEGDRTRAETEKATVVAKKEPAESAKATAPEILVDVEQVPAGTPRPKKDAYAVVIGIEKYADLAPPEYAVRDAKWVKEYLIHVLGYPEENINLLVNEQATKSRVESAFETWLPNQDPKGAVFVYYSGHGAPDPATGESYLVPADGSPGDLKRTGYSLKQLAQVLGKLPAKEIVIAVDSCFSGQPGTRSVIAKGTKPMVIAQEGPWAALGERGIVFTAGNQVSTVYEEKKHGLFTYFFLKGLQGAADINDDGAVQVHELFTYLRPEVVKTAKRQNVRQEPGLWPPQEQLGPRATRALAAVAR